MEAGAEGPQLSGEERSISGSTEKGACNGSLRSCNCLRQAQPQSTEPPFTFSTSPVMWRVQSEPRNTIALAIPELSCLSSQLQTTRALLLLTTASRRA